MGKDYLQRRGSKVLGELLVEKGCIGQEQCDAALEYGRQHGIRLGEALITLGYISRDLLFYVLAEQFGQRPIELESAMVDQELVLRFPRELLVRYQILPLLQVENELTVATSDPQATEGLDLLSALAPHLSIKVHLASADSVRRCLERALAGETGGGRRKERGAEAGKPGSPDYARWIAELCVRRPDCDVIIRTTSQGTKILQENAGGEQQELQGIPITEIGGIRKELLARSQVVDLTHGRAHAWANPQRSMDTPHVLEVQELIDLSGATMRLRAHAMLRGDKSRTMAGEEPLRLVEYASVAELETEIANYCAFSEGAGSVVVFQSVTRSLFLSATVLPFGLADIPAAVAVFKPRVIVFDCPADLETVGNILGLTTSPPRITMCVPAGTEHEHGWVSGFVEQYGPMVIQAEPGGARVIPADEWLNSRKRG